MFLHVLCVLAYLTYSLFFFELLAHIILCKFKYILEMADPVWTECLSWR
jgi:hypothetical protein